MPTRVTVSIPPQLRNFGDRIVRAVRRAVDTTLSEVATRGTRLLKTNIRNTTTRRTGRLEDSAQFVYSRFKNKVGGKVFPYFPATAIEGGQYGFIVDTKRGFIRLTLPELQRNLVAKLRRNIDIELKREGLT